MAYAKPGKGLLKLNGETRISKQGSQQQHNGVCSSRPGMRTCSQQLGIGLLTLDVQYHIRQLLGRVPCQQCRECTQQRSVPFCRGFGQAVVWVM